MELSKEDLSILLSALNAANLSGLELMEKVVDLSRRLKAESAKLVIEPKDAKE